MDIASLILGILALLASWVPVIGFLWIPGAVIGIILGAVSVAGMKKKEDKSQQGVSIAGLVVSIVALLSIIGFTIFWANAGEDHVFDLEEVIEEQGAQPADVNVISGDLGFQTLAYNCQVDAVDPSVSASTCNLDFQVTNTGPEDIVVNSTDQQLVYASLTPLNRDLAKDLVPRGKYTFSEIDATGGDCVDSLLAPGEVKVCQAVFAVLFIYDPQFVSYTQSPESAPSRLVILPRPEAPGLNQ